MCYDWKKPMFTVWRTPDHYQIAVCLTKNAQYKLEGQWPWIPRALQQFVDAGWSVFTIINFGNNELFCE